MNVTIQIHIGWKENKFRESAHKFKSIHTKIIKMQFHQNYSSTNNTCHQHRWWHHRWNHSFMADNLKFCCHKNDYYFYQNNQNSLDIGTANRLGANVDFDWSRTDVKPWRKRQIMLFSPWYVYCDASRSISWFIPKGSSLC